MIFKIPLFLGSVLFAFNASAVDVSQCPQQITFHAKVDRVFKSSIYKDTPGWKEAQSTLAATSESETEFALIAKKKTVCIYEDGAQSRAVLSTSSFQDPEERNPSLQVQLIVNLSIEGSAYVSYIPVKGYSPQGVETYSSPFPIKIKTRLYNARIGRDSDYDMGMISVTLN